MTIALDTINLFVQNMKKTLFFYGLLGFTFSEDDYEKSYVKLNTSSVSLCFYSQDTVNEFFNSELIHSNSSHQFELSFRVDKPEEVDTIYNKMIEQGYNSFRKPENSTWNQRVAFLKDPDNNLIEINALLNGLEKDE